MRARRWFTRLGIGALGIAGLALISGVGFAGWLTTATGNLWLKTTITTAVSATMDEGAFEIDTLRTDLVSRLDVEGLRIVDGLGRPYLELPEARARFDITSLLTGPLRVKTLDARGFGLVLDRGDERLKLAELFGPPSESTEPFALPFDLVVDAVRIDGAGLSLDDTLRLESTTLTGRLVTRGPVFDVQDTRACGHLVQPGPVPVCAEGPVVWDGFTLELPGLAVEGPGTALALEGTIGDDVDITVSAGRVDLEGLDPLANRTGLRGVLGGTLTAKGPLDGLVLNGAFAGQEGTVGALQLDGSVAFGDRITWAADVETQGIDVAQLYASTPMPVLLDGTLGLQGDGVRYPDDLTLDLQYAGKVAVDATYFLRDSVFEGQIHEGLLTLSKGDFDGVAGPLGATGSIDLVNGPLRLDVNGRLDDEQLASLGIDGLLADGDARLTVTSDLRNDDGRYAIGGRVRYAPFRYTDDVTLDRLDVTLAGWTRAGDFRFQVDLDGTGASAYGLQAATLTGRELTVVRDPDGIDVLGPVDLQTVHYPGLGTFQTASAQVDASLPTAGDRVVNAGVTLGAFDLQTFLGTGGLATIGLVGDHTTFDVALDDGSRPFLRTTGDYDLAAGTLATRSFAVSPTPRLDWTSSGSIALRVVDGGIADSRIHLRGSHGDIDLDGDLATTGPLDGRVKVIGLQLDALAELFPDSFSGLSGVLTLDTTVAGDASAAQLDGRVDLDGLWMEDVTRWLDVDGTFTSAGRDLALDLDLGSAGDPLGRLAGTVPVALDLSAPAALPDAPVDLDLALAAGPLDRLQHVSVTDLGLPAGRASGKLDVTGLLGDPTLAFAGILETPLDGWTEDARIEAHVDRDGERLSTHLVLREGLAERAVVEGDATTRMGDLFASLLGDAPAPDTSDLRLWADEIVVTTRLDDVPVDAFARAAGSQLPTTGDLLGNLVVSGDPYTPRLDGELQWSTGSVGDVPIEAAHLLFRPTTGGLAVQSVVGFDHGQLLVEGEVPLAIDLREDSAEWARGPVDLRLDGQDVPLALLSVIDGVRQPRGKLVVDGTLRGTVQDPDVDLTARVYDGSLVYEPLGLGVTDITMDAEGRGRRLKLTNLVARTEPLHPIGLLDETSASIVRVAGAANLDGGTLQNLSAQVRLDDAWVMGTFDSAIRLDGGVRLSGAWPALNVDGDLDLVNGRYVYRADDAVATAPLQPVDAIVIHRDGTSLSFREPEERPIYEQFDIDLSVDLKRNLEVVAVTPFFDDLGQLTATITQANVNARVGGEVDVGLNEDASWRLGGEVDVVDGTVQVLRARFRLDEGRLVLVPDDVGTSPLDFSATSNVQDTPIQLRISGTVDEPSLEATAEGFDQSQVIVMLLTGRSIDGLTSTQGQAATTYAATAAAALLTSTVLSGAASGALSFEADGSVRVGAPFSASVYSELLLRPFADTEENGVALSVEWALIQKLLLEAGAGNRYQWLDVSWETRF